MTSNSYRHGPLCSNQGTDTLIGKQFNQYRVRNPSIDYMGGFYTAVYR